MVIVAQFGVLGGILWAARNTLSPYLLGLSLAYLLSPLVSFFERGFTWLARRRRMGFFKKAGRPLSILLVYLLSLALIAGFIALNHPMVKDQAVALWDQREAIWEAISRWGADALAHTACCRNRSRRSRRGADEPFHLGHEHGAPGVGGHSGGDHVHGQPRVAILIIPFWTFFLLKDYDQLKNSTLICSRFVAHRYFDVAAVGRPDVKFLFTRAITAGCGSSGDFGHWLDIIGVRFSLLLGIVAGVFELIPNIGPVLGASRRY
jgi:predicted PurR-regulated permease PerM